MERMKYNFCQYQQKATDFLLVWTDFSFYTCDIIA